MKRVFVLALALLFAPAVVSAQVEIGLDAGFNINKVDDADDTGFNFDIPTMGARVGFMAGESAVVETMLAFDYGKLGDVSGTDLLLVPGLNYLVGEQFYVRGEAGLSYSKFDDGTTSTSSTQYLFGAGAGIRQTLGDAALLRLEAGIDRLLENTDDAIPASWNFRLVVGVSAVAS